MQAKCDRWSVTYRLWPHLDDDRGHIVALRRDAVEGASCLAEGLGNCLRASLAVSPNNLQSAFFAEQFMLRRHRFLDTVAK